MGNQSNRRKSRLDLQGPAGAAIQWLKCHSIIGLGTVIKPRSSPMRNSSALQCALATSEQSTPFSSVAIILLGDDCPTKVGSRLCGPRRHCPAFQFSPIKLLALYTDTHGKILYSYESARNNCRSTLEIRALTKQSQSQPILEMVWIAEVTPQSRLSMAVQSVA